MVTNKKDGYARAGILLSPSYALAHDTIATLWSRSIIIPICWGGTATQKDEVTFRGHTAIIPCIRPQRSAVLTISSFLFPIHDLCLLMNHAFHTLLISRYFKFCFGCSGFFKQRKVLVFSSEYHGSLLDPLAVWNGVGCRQSPLKHQAKEYININASQLIKEARHWGTHLFPSLGSCAVCRV